MSGKRNGDLNNLNTSLHSIISGDGKHETINIPFVDDESSPLVRKKNEKSSDSISSNESYTEKVNFAPGRRTAAKMPYKNTTGNEASGESDTDDGDLALERRDKPSPLVSDYSRKAESSNLGVMRRNSISMPVLNEMDLDTLRNLHIKACESSDTMDDSKENLDQIKVRLRLFWDGIQSFQSESFQLFKVFKAGTKR